MIALSRVTKYTGKIDEYRQTIVSELSECDRLAGNGGWISSGPRPSEASLAGLIGREYGNAIRPSSRGPKP